MMKRSQAKKPVDDLVAAIPKTMYVDPEWLHMGERDALLRVSAVRRSLEKKPEFIGFIPLETEDEVIENPYSTIREKDTQKRSLRNDPLAGLKSRGFIEHHEYMAGRRWQVYYEASQVGGVRAIDPGKEAVDGGKMADPISVQRMEASDIIAAAAERLGAEGAMLVCDVLGHSLTVKEVAAIRGHSTKREELYIGARFRECLGTLAQHWGLMTQSR